MSWRGCCPRSGPPSCRSWPRWTRAATACGVRGLFRCGGAVMAAACGVVPALACCMPCLFVQLGLYRRSPLRWLHRSRCLCTAPLQAPFPSCGCRAALRARWSWPCGPATRKSAVSGGAAAMWHVADCGMLQMQDLLCPACPHYSEHVSANAKQSSSHLAPLLTLCGSMAPPMHTYCYRRSLPAECKGARHRQRTGAASRLQCTCCMPRLGHAMLCGCFLWHHLCLLH